jgi:uncharacterized membrane protein YdcZ (DUF606 family)
LPQFAEFELTRAMRGSSRSRHAILAWQHLAVMGRLSADIALAALSSRVWVLGGFGAIGVGLAFAAFHLLYTRVRKPTGPDLFSPWWTLLFGTLGAAMLLSLLLYFASVGSNG